MLVQATRGWQRESTPPCIGHSDAKKLGYNMPFTFDRSTLYTLLSPKNDECIIFSSRKRLD